MRARRASPRGKLLAFRAPVELRKNRGAGGRRKEEKREVSCRQQSMRRASAYFRANKIYVPETRSTRALMRAAPRNFCRASIIHTRRTDGRTDAAPVRLRAN